MSTTASAACITNRQYPPLMNAYWSQPTLVTVKSVKYIADFHTLDKSCKLYWANLKTLDFIMPIRNVKGGMEGWTDTRDSISSET